MNLSVTDAGGSVLLVSQFTLLGDARHGRRPSFIRAARPETAEPLCEALRQQLEARGVPTCTGRFRTHMKVELLNDGPVTILLDSRQSASNHAPDAMKTSAPWSAALIRKTPISSAPTIAATRSSWIPATICPR